MGSNVRKLKTIIFEWHAEETQHSIHWNVNTPQVAALNWQSTEDKEAFKGNPKNGKIVIPYNALMDIYSKYGSGGTYNGLTFDQFQQSAFLPLWDNFGDMDMYDLH